MEAIQWKRRKETNENDFIQIGWQTDWPIWVIQLIDDTFLAILDHIHFPCDILPHIPSWIFAFQKQAKFINKWLTSSLHVTLGDTDLYLRTPRSVAYYSIPLQFTFEKSINKPS